MLRQGSCGFMAVADKHQAQHHFHCTHSFYHQLVGVKFSTDDSSDRVCETGKVALCLWSRPCTQQFDSSVNRHFCPESQSCSL